MYLIVLVGSERTALTADGADGGVTVTEADEDEYAEYPRAL